MSTLREIWALHDEAGLRELQSPLGMRAGVEFFLHNEAGTGKRLFLARFPPGYRAEDFDNVLFRSLVIQMLDFGAYSELTFVILKQELADIFISFADDLLLQTGSCEDAGTVALTISAVLSQWAKLFERAFPQRLSPEAEKGLFGELYLLRTLLEEGYSSRALEAAWEGPLWADRDFCFPTAKLEVKLSTAKHPSLRISSERQLELLDGEREFILFYEMNQSAVAGENLRELVEAVREIMATEPMVLDRMNEKINAYGYIDEEGNAYTKRLALRRLHIFRVGETFPRITSGLVSPGLFNISYEIELSACEPHRIDFTTITGIINGN